MAALRGGPADARTGGLPGAYAGVGGQGIQRPVPQCLRLPGQGASLHVERRPPMPSAVVQYRERAGPAVVQPERQQPRIVDRRGDPRVVAMVAGPLRVPPTGVAPPERLDLRLL